MALTYFYAELFGIVLAVLGLAMLVNQSMMRDALRDMLENRGVLLIMGIVTLVLGLLVVLTHNIWNAGLLAVIVSLIGWLMIIKGVVLQILPHGTLHRIYQSELIGKLWLLIAIIALVIGLYLAWSGFAGSALAY